MKNHLNHSVIVKAPGLLPMLYKPCELADELGIPHRTIYDWLRAGAPFSRDEENRMWVNGQEFADWVDKNRKAKALPKSSEDEGYCFHCQGIVTLLDKQTERIKGSLIRIRGKCPKCQGDVYRGGRQSGTQE
jgi:hypothetical protein